MARSKKEWNPVKATLAAVRKAHFAAGGTPAMWMRQGSVVPDARKVASRKACRKPISRDE